LATFVNDMRIARVQRTLRWLEEDAPLLALRVKDLSAERQRLAQRFAANMIDHTRAELERLMEERAHESEESELPCEPAD
jgi:CRP-like cAMP-binding protein